jgi:hypothetical protein
MNKEESQSKSNKDRNWVLEHSRLKHEELEDETLLLLTFSLLLEMTEKYRTTTTQE